MTGADLLAALAVGIPSTIVALAYHKQAQAQLTWAQRCDPKNPNYRSPVIGRK